MLWLCKAIARVDEERIGKIQLVKKQNARLNEK